MPSCPSFPPLNRKNEPVDFWNTTRLSCIHFFSSPLSYFRFSKFLICSYKFLTTPEIHPCTVPLTSIISFQVLLRYMYVSLCMVYVCVHATCVYVVYVSACVYSYCTQACARVETWYICVFYEYVYSCVHTCMCMCRNVVYPCIVWICVFICAHTHVYVQKCGTSVYCMHMCIHMCICVHIVCMCACVYM